MTRIAVLGSGLAIGVACVAVGRANPGWWFAGESDAAAALELVAGLAVVGAGAGAWHRHPGSRFGALLCAAGVAWFLPELNNPEVGSALAFTAGLALVAACPPLVAHAALAYPTGRLRSRAERVAVGVAYLASLGLVGVLSAFFFDPAAAGCARCPDNLLLIAGRGSLVRDLLELGLRLGPLWVGLLLVLSTVRVLRGSVAERRLVLPVLIPVATYLVAVAWGFQRSASRGFLGNDDVDLSLWTAQAAALCLVAAGATWEWVRTRRTRSALAAIVVELERSPAPGGFRAALARRLGDPSLELLYELPGGSLVDASGRPPAAGAGGQLTHLVSGGRSLAVVAHRPGLFDDPGLAQEVVSAARLALDNDRLHAQLRAQLEDLRASRARIVEAGDTERRRLERDLHDGAQQRLVALSFSIGLAMVQNGAHASALERAQREVGRLLDELRRLAHGLYPVVLAEEGLAAAVDVLAEGSRVPLRLASPLPDQRLHPQVETAAYLVIREVMRDERRTWASVETLRENDRLIVEVAGDGAPPEDLVHLEDRVGAAGGWLAVEQSGQGATRLRAELPCG